MNETTARPLDSDQNVTNQGLLGKLEAANKSMEEIKVLNNTTRDLVSDDLKVLSLIENPLEANEALIVIGHKAKIQPIYRTELQESNPDVSKKAEDALHKYELKLIEDEREATIGQVDKSKAIKIGLFIIPIKEHNMPAMHTLKCWKNTNQTTAQLPTSTKHNGIALPYLITCPAAT